MPLPPEFWDKLRLRGDAELCAILAHPGDYQPEALEAIRRELEHRNLAPAEDARLQEEAAVQKAAEDRVASGRLGWPVRLAVLAGAVPLFLLFAVLVMHYKRTGQKRKVRDCGVWFLAGLLLWPVALFAGYVAANRHVRERYMADHVLMGMAIGAGVAVVLLVGSFLRVFNGKPAEDE